MGCIKTKSMKVKLLKKLRKEAHDAYRIAPSFDDGYEVQVYTDIWERYRWFPTLEEAVCWLNSCRHSRFVRLAYDLLYERRVKKLSKY